MFHSGLNKQIKQAKLFAYQLPFKTNMPFKQYQLQHREGLILQLTDQAGINHFAEVAPLPGFSNETLAQAKQELMQLLTLKAKDLKSYITSHKNHCPSVQFALDSLFYKQQSSFFGSDNIPLIQGDKLHVIDQYRYLGFPDVIKLKVARGSVQADIDNFHALCQLNPQLQIRCDANQAWSRQQAEHFFKAINIEQLDYIEEPTSKHSTNLSLAQQYQLKLGLDETLQQADFCYQHHHAIKALVIKPMILGSKQKIDQLVDIAKQNNIQISISSSFESIVGLQQLQALACSYALQQGNQHLLLNLGIDTLKYFNSSLLMDKKQIEQDCQKLELLYTCN